jgi:AcrR family transcriptional regulator
MSEHSLMVETIETKPTLRRRIIEAADALIREHGLAGATTREIARAAGCAEGSIYVHFEDKIDLVIAVIVEREPYFAELLELPNRAGEETVEANLVPWVEELLKLVADNQPIFYALMGDRSVFTRFKERLRERETGPVAIFRTAAEYIRAEQELGRVDGRAHPDVVASILIGACRDQVLTHALAGKQPREPGLFARELVHTIVFGVAPPGGRLSNSKEDPS